MTSTKYLYIPCACRDMQQHQKTRPIFQGTEPMFITLFHNIDTYVMVYFKAISDHNINIYVRAHSNRMVH